MSISRSADSICGDEGKSFRSLVEQIRSNWAKDAPKELSEPAVDGVVWAVDRFLTLAKSDSAERDKELTLLLRLVAEAGTAIVSSGTEQHEQLCAISEQIEAVSKTDDIREVRRNLSKYVVELAQIAKKAQEHALHHSQKLEKELHATTERLKVAESLAGLDELTGIGNRRMAETAMEQFLKSGTTFAVMLFDLDNFKPVNDIHGHLCGDQLLRAVANQLQSLCRSTDSVCRIGGDEFLVLLPGISQVQAEMRAKRAQENDFGEFLVTVNGAAVRVDVACSVGVAQSKPRDRSTEILARADEALYKDKATRRKKPSRT
jgi:diguanylate cyclase (GGDEF)-like protein